MVALAALVSCDRNAPSPPTASPLRILASDPAQQARDVPREKALRFRTSTLVRPTSVIRQSVLVTPGLIDEETGEIAAGSVFFEPRWDPYDRVVTFELPPGNRWIPSTLYSVSVLLPDDPAGVAGLRTLEGAPLQEPVTLGFMPGEAVSDPSHDVDDTWPVVGFCEGAPDAGIVAIEQIFRGSCGSGACHGGSEPAMGLRLDTPEGIRGTTIRVTARETMHAPQVGAPAANPSTFGDAMPRIDPGNPGNSYLVYKLLIHEGNYAGAGEQAQAARAWLGDLPPDAAIPTSDIDSLRATFVQGEPMPVSGTLTPAMMRGVVTWVAQGAQIGPCSSAR